MNVTRLMTFNYKLATKSMHPKKQNKNGKLNRAVPRLIFIFNIFRIVYIRPILLRISLSINFRLKMLEIAPSIFKTTKDVSFPSVQLYDSYIFG